VLSSTSSSKSIFIKRAVGAFVAISVVYSLFIVVAQLEPGAGLNQWQENRIRIQTYLYARTPYRCVILGSSMGTRIPASALDSNDINLSLSGDNALTGAEIVKRAGHFPRCLIVELNATLNRQLNTELVAQQTEGIAHFFRKYMPMVREGYQPIVLLGSALKKKTSVGVKPDQVAANFNEHLDSRKAIETKVLPAEEWAETLAALDERLSFLQAQGVRVFLFDLPRHPDLVYSVQGQAVQATAHARFKGRFEWIESDPDLAYQTEDGQHLTTSSGLKFAHYLMQQVDQKLGEFSSRN
jgi:hypothetical protein